MDVGTVNQSASDKKELLKVSNLHVEYRTLDGVVKAVNGATFRVDDGEAFGLVGETGAGKTTTALSIMNLVPNPPGVTTRGEIIFDQKRIFDLPDKAMQTIRGNRISMIFQNPMASLNPVYTVGKQIMEVLELHQNLSKQAAREKAAEMLRTVNILENRMDDYPHEFSGGMQQRISIAMSLACRPKLLIADEPTTALDVTIQAQVLELMKGLKKDFSSSLILITHDLGLVAEICDKVAVMYAGFIVEHGTLRHLFNHPLHPYTLGLFNSIPSLDKSVSRLQPIAGLSPDPKNLPSGCPFHPRCPYAMDICSQKMPEKTEAEPGHELFCWKHA